MSKNTNKVNENMDLSNTSISDQGNLQGGIGPGTFLSHPKKPGLIIMITRPLDENGQRYEAMIVQQNGHDTITDEHETFEIDKAAIDQYHKVVDLDPETAEKWRQLADLKPMTSSDMRNLNNIVMSQPGALNEQLVKMKSWMKVLK